MKKTPHIIWVCPESHAFFRSKGEVRCRPGSVVPKIAEHGIKIDVLIPHDPSLLPKSKLSSARVSKHTIRLSQDYSVEVIKLSRGSVSPGLYMAKLPVLEPAITSAVFAKTAIALAQSINKPVDIFHVFSWESALVPLYLELENNGSRIFKNTKTFLSVQSLRNQGNFSPAVLNYIGIPKELFHPSGIEFYGKVSFLKSGLLFADSVGVVDEPSSGRSAHYKNGTGLEGVLDSLTYKLRRWASDRSLRTHLEAYTELLAINKTQPLLPHLIKKLHNTEDEAKKFIESWGPPVPECYQNNTISFLMQSPQKGYVLWEWTQPSFSDFGLILEDRNSGARHLLGRGLPNIGDFWVNVQSDHIYVAELVGWNSKGVMTTLLRSKPLRISRNSPSQNTNAVFIDTKNHRRFTINKSNELVEKGSGSVGLGTSAWEWTFGNSPSSFGLGKK